MIRGKIRHQLFLPDEMSRRVAEMAKSQKRPRSGLLLDILEAYLDRRAASPEDQQSLRLDRLEREVRRISNELAAVSHMLSVFIRHQAIYNASLPPPDDAARALGERRFQNLLDSVARTMAKRTSNGSGPPGEDRARRSRTGKTGGNGDRSLRAGGDRGLPRLAFRGAIHRQGGCPGRGMAAAVVGARKRSNSTQAPADKRGWLPNARPPPHRLTEAVMAVASRGAQRPESPVGRPCGHFPVPGRQ